MCRPPLKCLICDTFDLVGVQDSTMQNYVRVEGLGRWYDEMRMLSTYYRLTV